MRVLALVREDLVVQRHEVSGLQGADRFHQAVRAAVDLHFGRSWVSHLAFDQWDLFASEASLHATHLSPRRRFSAGHVRMGPIQQKQVGRDPQRVSQRFSISESACGLTPRALATAALRCPPVWIGLGRLGDG
jgi:hypothetical protein